MLSGLQQTSNNEKQILSKIPSPHYPKGIYVDKKLHVVHAFLRCARKHHICPLVAHYRGVLGGRGAAAPLLHTKLGGGGGPGGNAPLAHGAHSATNAPQRASQTLNNPFLYFNCPICNTQGTLQIVELNRNSNGSQTKHKKQTKALHSLPRTPQGTLALIVERSFHVHRQKLYHSHIGFIGNMQKHNQAQR